MYQSPLLLVTMMQRQVVPPWVEEHPEVFDADFSLTADEQDFSVASDSVFRMQGSNNDLSLCVCKEELPEVLLTCNVCSLYINTNAVSPSLSDSDESSRVTTTECQAELLEAVLGDSGMLLCMRSSTQNVGWIGVATSHSSG